MASHPLEEVLYVDWEPMIQEFVAMKPAAAPEARARLLAKILERAETWPTFIGASWVWEVPLQADSLRERGFGPMRALKLAEDFVDYLHSVPEGLGDWEHELLRSHFALERWKHGARREDTPRPAPLAAAAIPPEDLEALAMRFAETIDDPFLKTIAGLVVHNLQQYLFYQFGHPGPLGRLPLGSVDAAAMIADYAGQEEANDAREAHRDLYRLLAQLYRWLGDTGQLHPPRARELADLFAQAGAWPLTRPKAMVH